MPSHSSWNADKPWSPADLDRCSSKVCRRAESTWPDMAYTHAQEDLLRHRLLRAARHSPQGWAFVGGTASGQAGILS